MKINVPSLYEQRVQVVKREYEESINLIQNNINAPLIDVALSIDESQYGTEHLADKKEYKSPHIDIVVAYFEQFKSRFPEYGTDDNLASLLGLGTGKRIREYKGGKPIPFDIWKRFLVITGRKSQDIYEVFGFFK